MSLSELTNTTSRKSYLNGRLENLYIDGDLFVKDTKFSIDNINTKIRLKSSVLPNGDFIQYEDIINIGTNSNTNFSLVNNAKEIQADFEDGPKRFFFSILLNANFNNQPTQYAFILEKNGVSFNNGDEGFVLANDGFDISTTCYSTIITLEKNDTLRILSTFNTGNNNDVLVDKTDSSISMFEV